MVPQELNRLTPQSKKYLKPFIANTLSDFKKGPWQEVWDSLFWCFMHVHGEFFLQNPGFGMFVKSYDKMPVQKQKMHLLIAV